MSLYRFPDWLAQERFDISYDPTAPGRWVVTLYDVTHGASRGYGSSIALAAKRAAALRARHLSPVTRHCPK